MAICEGLHVGPVPAKGGQHGVDRRRRAVTKVVLDKRGESPGRPDIDIAVPSAVLQPRQGRAKAHGVAHHAPEVVVGQCVQKLGALATHDRHRGPSAGQVPHSGRELSLGTIDPAGVEGEGHGKALKDDFALLQAGFDGIEFTLWSGHREVPVEIRSGELAVLAQERFPVERWFGQDGDHPAPQARGLEGHGLFDDGQQGVVHVEATGHARSGERPETRAEAQVGLDAGPHQALSHRVLDHEDCRMREQGSVEHLRCR